MNELKKRRAAGESGFTLIELLVVIAILAVLAGVVVFSLSGAGDNGQQAACDIDRKTIETSVAAHRAQEGDYPENINELVPTYMSDDSVYHDITGFSATAPPTITLASGVNCT